MTVENRRAKQVWRRMTQIYGARFQEQFGKEPSNAWADAIEDMPDEKLSFGLRKITREHPIHPPPLGAFVQACNDMPEVFTNTMEFDPGQLAAYTPPQPAAPGEDSGGKDEGGSEGGSDDD